MHDRQIHLSLTRALAVLGMTLGAICGLLPFVVRDPQCALALSSLGLILFAGGGVMLIKSYLCGLHEQLRNAYELGRMAEREGVTNLRR